MRAVTSQSLPRTGPPRAEPAAAHRPEPAAAHRPGPAEEDGAGRPPTWTIAQIADEFGLTHRTVRHYEDIGLIAPERRGTTRVYHRRERIRLALILRGKRLGFPLEQIRTIVDLYDAPRGEVGQLEYLLSQIDARRADLEQRRRDIEDAQAELEQLEAACREDLARLEGRPG